VYAGACLQMIIVSELIIKLDEQPLSSAAAAHTTYLYTRARVAWFPEQIFGGKRAGETACLLFFHSV
jgi:hypothetical protein